MQIAFVCVCVWDCICVCVCDNIKVPLRIQVSKEKMVKPVDRIKEDVENIKEGRFNDWWTIDLPNRGPSE